MKENKALIIKIVRVVVFIGLIIFSGIMLLDESRYLNWIMFYSISLITGLVGMFFEMYKK